MTPSDKDDARPFRRLLRAVGVGWSAPALTLVLGTLAGCDSSRPASALAPPKSTASAPVRAVPTVNVAQCAWPLGPERAGRTYSRAIAERFGAHEDHEAGYHLAFGPGDVWTISLEAKASMGHRNEHRFHGWVRSDHAISGFEANTRNTPLTGLCHDQSGIVFDLTTHKKGESITIFFNSDSCVEFFLQLDGKDASVVTMGQHQTPTAGAHFAICP